MKKLILFFAFLVGAVIPSGGQNSVNQPEERAGAERPSKPIYLAVQGSILLSVNENVFSYVDNRRIPDLLTPQGGLQLGYYFTNNWSMRLAAYFGQNASAANTVDTAAHGFYPYKFKSANFFLDVVFDFLSRGDAEKLRTFYPRIYFGLGYAHTFGFTDSGHPWQKIDPVNNEFGFRLGFMGEFAVNRTFSFFFDLCGEGYGDQYNGLQPSVEDQNKKQGYAGFPLDLRFVASLGVIFHF
ncbi:MAG: hypothetical protein IJ753_07525 [Bacteroidales bacterium]|nr:hypothetical protein [Bacteroidales bacterium]